MDKINDGGPAFGQVVELRCVRVGMDGSEEYEPALAQGGMTIRDYFAAKAMQGIVSSIDGEANYQRLRGHAAGAGLSVSEWIARDAYKQADAMLKAREVKNEQG